MYSNILGLQRLAIIHQPDKEHLYTEVNRDGCPKKRSYCSLMTRTQSCLVLAQFRIILLRASVGKTTVLCGFAAAIGVCGEASTLCLTSLVSIRSRYCYHSSSCLSLFLCFLPPSSHLFLSLARRPSQGARGAVASLPKRSGLITWLGKDMTVSVFVVCTKYKCDIYILHMTY